MGDGIDEDEAAMFAFVIDGNTWFAYAAGDLTQPIYMGMAFPRQVDLGQFTDVNVTISGNPADGYLIFTGLDAENRAIWFGCTPPPQRHRRRGGWRRRRVGVGGPRADAGASTELRWTC